MPKKKTDSTATGSARKRDYAAVALAYAREAVADKGRKKFCKWMRLAAKRHLIPDDLKQALAKSLRLINFDKWHA